MASPTTTESPLAKVNGAIDDRLDDFEERLPPLPRKIVQFQRALGERVKTTLVSSSAALSKSVGTVAKRSKTATKTVTGTARWAGGQTAEVAGVGAKTVVGQAKAQAGLTSDLASEEAEKLSDKAATAVSSARRTTVKTVDAVTEALDPSEPVSGPYPSWTKAQLYERAQELDIDGRGTMNKAQLVTALRSHS